ncbi:MAG: hypothetical protein WB609_07555 [Candidatus Cybelea sp.]
MKDRYAQGYIRPTRFRRRIRCDRLRHFNVRKHRTGVVARADHALDPAGADRTAHSDATRNANAGDVVRAGDAVGDRHAGDADRAADAGFRSGLAPAVDVSRLRLVRVTSGISIAAAILAGCGGSPNPAGIPGTAAQTSASVAQERHGGSWMLRRARSQKILYVSYFYGNDVLAYSFPGGQPVGMVTGIPEAQGECTSSASGGNWWVVATGANEVLEYAHAGTSAIATLNISGGTPAACAVDPTTGNLAVTIITTNQVVVFKNGAGPGTTYTTPFQPFFCGYDNRGNLYVDGSGVTPLARLRKGRSTFEPITVDQTIEFAGNVQWHGGYLAVGDQETSNIYQFAINGTAATKAGTTTLDGGDAAGFWIQNHDVIALQGGNVGIWSYPAGGPPVDTIAAGFYGSIDATVSLPP